MNTGWKYALVALALMGGACGEGSTPLSPVPDPNSAFSVAEATGVGDRILVRAADAPPLETLEGKFWAVAGERQTFRIRYDVPFEQENPSPDFFRLELQNGTLAARPDGAPFAPGDSVLITVTVDPMRLLVRLEPSGLVFDPDEPAELSLWYGRMDPDLNRDGVVDAADAVIENTGLGVYVQADPSSDWVRLASDRDPLSRRFRTEIEHFSGYAVSY